MKTIPLINNHNPYRVGNWVTDICGHLMQIRAIDRNLAAGWYVDDDDTVHEATGVVDGAIGVVLITPELLRRIGFQANKYGDLFLVVDKDGKKGELNEESTLKTLRVKRVNRDGEFDLFMKCEYLYELQNALSLARLDDIIIDISGV